MDFTRRASVPDLQTVGAEVCPVSSYRDGFQTEIRSGYSFA